MTKMNKIVYKYKPIGIIHSPFKVFATRIPGRQSPIGISVVRLVKVERCMLHTQDVDILDGTPLLDIKPYIPDFDARITEQIGWLFGKSSNVYEKRSNGRLV